MVLLAELEMAGEWERGIEVVDFLGWLYLMI
jgi:hypothetical protein